MRHYLSIVIFFTGLILGIYVGYWILFIEPIITCVVASNAGLLTATMTKMAIIKCTVSWLVAGTIFGIGYIIAAIISKS